CRLGVLLGGVYLRRGGRFGFGLRLLGFGLRFGGRGGLGLSLLTVLGLSLRLDLLLGPCLLFLSHAPPLRFLRARCESSGCGRSRASRGEAAPSSRARPSPPENAG